MASKWHALLSAVILSLGIVFFAQSSVLAADTAQSQKEKWNEWIAGRIKQSWIEMYAAEKNVDPASVKWEDLPADLRARFAQAFENAASK
ncbi:hypothetical protein [Megalodesulfovibrio paquesii]